MKVFSIPLRTRFRGITVREGVLIEGEAGWGELSPFLEYDAAASAPWLACALEAADVGWPAPLRDVGPGQRDGPRLLARAGARDRPRVVGCRTAKVKVAEPGQSLAEDEARLEAVRDALGPDGLVRIDVNGGWSVDEAVTRIPVLDRAAGGLEYVEQPVATVEDLAAVRRRVSCRSPPTSRSAGRTTPTGSATSRPPTSPCSRCSRWAAYAPACGSRRTSACRSWCPAPSSRASGSRRASPWPRRCPSCPTRAASRRCSCSPATWWPTRCSRSTAR